MLAAILLASSRCSSTAVSPTPSSMVAEAPEVPLETPEALEADLRRMAASEDPVELLALEQLLGDPKVLERLDPSVEGYRPMGRLLAVLDVLVEHPSPYTEALGQALLRDEVFVSVPQRTLPLYRVLAAVVPTSEANAAIFRAASAQGLHQTLAPNLAANGSPRALEVLADILRDPNLAIEERVEVAHRALVPHRTSTALLEMCTALLDAGAEPLIELAVIESVFHDEARRWFGVAASVPVPPAWETLSPRGRQLIVGLGQTALRRRDLTPELRAAIGHALAEVQRWAPDGADHDRTQLRRRVNPSANSSAAQRALDSDREPASTLQPRLLDGSGDGSRASMTCTVNDCSACLPVRSVTRKATGWDPTADAGGVPLKVPVPSGRAVSASQD